MKLGAWFVLLAVFCSVLAFAALTPGIPEWLAVAAVFAVALTLVALYRKTVKPMRVILGGMNLLGAQDFASRIRRVGQRDADMVVDMFNRMIGQLHRDRLHVREQNMFMDLLIKASPMGVIIFGDDGCTVSSANDAACRMMGVHDLVGCRLADLSSPLAREADMVKVDKPVTIRPDNSLELYRCSRLTFMDNGWQHAFMLVERLTEEVRRAERRAYVRIVRMMSHEVNNSLGSIMSTLQSLADVGQGNMALQACIGRSKAMSSFVRSLADLVKMPEPETVLTDWQEPVETSLPLLESICRGVGASLDVSFGNPTPVRLDPVLIQQVIINVVKNAAESASQGGRVTITVSGRTLTVADNGPGLSAGVTPKLFSDIVTTKPDGHGLGLMLVADILTKHGASFSLRTDGDGLTRFTVTV